jgi:hypothetical protein
MNPIDRSFQESFLATLPVGGTFSKPYCSIIEDTKTKFSFSSREVYISIADPLGDKNIIYAKQPYTIEQSYKCEMFKNFTGLQHHLKKKIVLLWFSQESSREHYIHSVLFLVQR